MVISGVVQAEAATGAATDAEIWHVYGVVAATAIELAPSVVITADIAADKDDMELLVDGLDVRVSAI